MRRGVENQSPMPELRDTIYKTAAVLTPVGIWAWGALNILRQPELYPLFIPYTLLGMFGVYFGSYPFYSLLRKIDDSLRKKS